MNIRATQNVTRTVTSMVTIAIPVLCLLHFINATTELKVFVVVVNIMGIMTMMCMNRTFGTLKLRQIVV